MLREQTVNQISLLRFFRGFFKDIKARQARALFQSVEQAISPLPLVGEHQRKALMHAQLAAEIGWKGVRK